VASVNFDAKQ